MISDVTSHTARRLIDRLGFVVIVALGLSVMSLLAAALWPIGTEVQAQVDSAQCRLGSLLPAPGDLMGTLDRIVGRTLIRPAQVKAAVKKTGVAERLAKQLKLHGIVRMPDGLVAYIAVAQEGVVDVRVGGRVLEFTVKQIGPGVVTLLLEGEEIELRN